MTRFIKQLMQFLLILCIPFGGLCLTYIYYDPFKVVYKYPSFYAPNQSKYISLNHDYCAVETFLTNYPTYTYNSFILGNSRSRFYEIETWRQYIHSDKCFHFDAAAESLFGICKKMAFLHDQKVDILNTLIVLDYSVLNATHNSEGYLFMKHPLLSGENKSIFQWKCFKAYSSFTFLSAFIDFKLSGNISEYMKISGFDDTPITYNLQYNETKWATFDALIKTDATQYYTAKRMHLFNQRDTIPPFSPEVIKKDQLMLLNKMSTILKEHNTHYKIIINPLFDQLKLNKKDVDVLKTIFGAETVYDFSGINAFTSDYHNYYENSHYRPFIADSILRRIYQ